MFYDRWLQIVRQHAQERALVECATGRAWTFAELGRLAEKSSKPSEKILFPQGHSADFIFSLLQAWRWGVVACPLEPGEKNPHIPLPPEPCVHFKTTSASTGAARVIAFTDAQLAADAENIVLTMGLHPDWPNLAAISMAHSYGFSNLVLPLLLHGIPLIIAPSPLPEVLRQAAEPFPALTLPGVPALWRAWHEAGAITPNVRLAISAGAPLPAALEQQVFAAQGLKIHNFYGSSECGGIAYDRSGRPRSDDACIGGAMENVSLSIDGNGCMCVASGAVGQTYWPEPDGALGQGRFQTSDLAEFKDGLVFLRGRVTDQINVAGRKVSPAIIEQALLHHSSIGECLVFGIPSQDADRTDCIVAVATCKSATTPEELKNFLFGRLPAWQVPREWWIVDSFPTNARGKISRAEWREKYLGRK